MAYRRLPNTDKARLTAIVRLNELLVIEESNLLNNHQEAIGSLKIVFEELIDRRNEFVTKRRVLNKTKRDLLVKLRLYVSHFLQVFTLAIDREDILKESRAFFKLEINTGVIPSLSKETDVIKWANNIVSGEQKRIEQGIEAISHPRFTRIKEIKEASEKIMDELLDLEKSIEDYYPEIIGQRTRIDVFIKQIWNKIEFQFLNEPIEIKRKKATHFGVVYVQ